jgi:hypothetical protein
MERTAKLRLYGTNCDFGMVFNFYDDCYSYEKFEKNFLNLYKIKDREQVKTNLSIIDSIYCNNYACMGYYDYMFQCLFQNDNRKEFNKAKRILLMKNEKAVERAFWRLGIL